MQCCAKQLKKKKILYKVSAKIQIYNHQYTVNLLDNFF